MRLKPLRPWAAAAAFFVVLAALMPSLALAQGAATIVGPPNTRVPTMLLDAGGHLMAGGALTSATVAGQAAVPNSGPGTLLGGVGIQNAGLGNCQYSTDTSQASWTSICTGFDSAGNPTLTYGRIGGVAPTFSINGVPFPGSSVQPRQINAINYYVSPTGNNSNNCLSVATPCLTWQFVANFALLNYDAKGSSFILNGAPGTYNSGFMCAGPITGGGSGNVSFDGSLLKVQGAGSASTIINDTTSGLAGAIIVSAGCVVQLQSLTVQTNQTNASDVFIQNGGIVESASDVIYGGTAVSGNNIHVEFGGLFEASNSFTVSGGTNQAAFACSGGSIELDPVGLTVTVAGAPSYNVAFAQVADGCLFFTGGNTFSGSATGPRGLVSTGGIIETNTAQLATYLPGNSNVIQRAGGIYNPDPGSAIGAQTGLGASGTAGPVSTLTSLSGTVSLNAASGATSGGNSSITFATIPQNQAGNSANCNASLNGEGTGGWNAGATVVVSRVPGGVTVAWNNNGVNLTPGSAYYYTYACTTR